MTVSDNVQYIRWAHWALKWGTFTLSMHEVGGRRSSSANPLRAPCIAIPNATPRASPLTHMQELRLAWLTNAELKASAIGGRDLG